MKLIRKVSLAKWKKSLEKGGSHISGDALTSCLRTQDNTLSVWKWETGEEYRTSLLALLASQTKIEKIDIVNFNLDDLISRALAVSDELPGKTAAESYAQSHRDIVDLDYVSLKGVAEMVLSEVGADNHVFVSKKEFKEIIVNGVLAGEVKFSMLNDSIRDDIESEIPLDLRK